MEARRGGLSTPRTAGGVARQGSLGRGGFWLLRPGAGCSIWGIGDSPRYATPRSFGPTVRPADHTFRISLQAGGLFLACLWLFGPAVSAAKSPTRGTAVN